MDKGDEGKKGKEDPEPETDAPDPGLQLKQIEYTVQGLNLLSFIDKDFLHKLRGSFGEIRVGYLSIFLADQVNFLGLSHVKYSDLENEIVTITIDKPVSKQILSKILGLNEE